MADKEIKLKLGLAFDTAAADKLRGVADPLRRELAKIAEEFGTRIGASLKGAGAALPKPAALPKMTVPEAAGLSPQELKQLHKQFGPAMTQTILERGSIGGQPIAPALEEVGEEKAAHQREAVREKERKKEEKAEEKQRKKEADAALKDLRKRLKQELVEKDKARKQEESPLARAAKRRLAALTGLGGRIAGEGAALTGPVRPRLPRVLPPKIPSVLSASPEEWMREQLKKPGFYLSPEEIKKQFPKLSPEKHRHLDAMQFEIPIETGGGGGGKPPLATAAGSTKVVPPPLPGLSLSGGGGGGKPPVVTAAGGAAGGARGGGGMFGKLLGGARGGLARGAMGGALGALGGGAAAGPIGLAVAGAMMLKKAVTAVATAPFKVISGGLAIVNKSMKEMTGPIGILGAALGHLESVFQIGGKIGGIFGKVSEAMGAVVGQVSAFLKMVPGIVQSFSPAKVKIFNLALNDAAAVLGERLTPVLEVMTDVVRTLADFFEAALPSGAEVKAALEPVREAFQELRKVLAPVAQQLRGAFTKALVYLTAVLKAAVMGLKELLSGLVDTTKAAGAELPDTRGKAGQPAAFKSVEEYAKGIYLAALNVGRESDDPAAKSAGYLKEIKKAVEAIADKITGGVSGAASGAKAGVQVMSGDFLGALRSMRMMFGWGENP